MEDINESDLVKADGQKDFLVVDICRQQFWSAFCEIYMTYHYLWHAFILYIN